MATAVQSHGMTGSDEPKRRGGRPRTSHCPRGHERTPDNTRWRNSEGKLKRSCRICANANGRTDLSRERRRDWYKKNSKRMRARRASWYKKNGNLRRAYNLKYINAVRDKVYSLLGNKCANLNCRHLNQDGTLGCVDCRLFQIDHVHGGGNKEYKELNGNRYAYFQRILKLEGKGYRILCAQCNWLHRVEDF